MPLSIRYGIPLGTVMPGCDWISQMASRHPIYGLGETATPGRRSPSAAPRKPHRQATPPAAEEDLSEAEDALADEGHQAQPPRTEDGPQHSTATELTLKDVGNLGENDAENAAGDSENRIPEKRDEDENKDGSTADASTKDL